MASVNLELVQKKEEYLFKESVIRFLDTADAGKQKQAIYDDIMNSGSKFWICTEDGQKAGFFTAEVNQYKRVVRAKVLFISIFQEFEGKGYWMKTVEKLLSGSIDILEIASFIETKDGLFSAGASTFVDKHGKETVWFFSLSEVKRRTRALNRKRRIESWKRRGK